MEALKIGKLREARQILDELVLREPDNAEAWEMLYSAVEDPLERFDCLKQVVRIHPKDERARQKLKKYKASGVYREASTASHQAGIEKEARVGILDGFRAIFSFIRTVIEILWQIYIDLRNLSWRRWR